MGWLGRKFISDYDKSDGVNNEIATPEEMEESRLDWYNRKMKDRLYPILDKIRYKVLKPEDVNESNFKNYRGVFIQEEYDWFIKNYSNK